MLYVYIYICIYIYTHVRIYWRVDTYSSKTQQLLGAWSWGLESNKKPIGCAFLEICWSTWSASCQGNNVRALLKPFQETGRCCSNLRERCFLAVLKPVSDQYFGTWDSKFSVPTWIQRILLGFDMLTNSMVHKKRAMLVRASIKLSHHSKIWDRDPA